MQAAQTHLGKQGVLAQLVAVSVQGWLPKDAQATTLRLVQTQPAGTKSRQI
jgi:hypothetical protein